MSDLIPAGKIDKGWGCEILWTNNEHYSGKLLVFNALGSKTSMVYHKDRRKSWFVNEGRFKLSFCDTKTAEYKDVVLETGMAFEVDTMVPHQLEALSEGGVIIEVGTKDIDADRYRIMPGDSQTRPPEPPQVPLS
jgi:mannose-6-phosphate isomerase-like protein (cupin superfamily)